MNIATLSGRLGKDAEMKQISDRYVYEFTLATDESKKNQDGTWGKETTWHNIVLYASTSKLAEMLKQGTQVTVSGRISNRQWEKDGVKHYRTEIVTDRSRIDIHLPKRDSQPQPVQSRPQTTNTNTQQVQQQNSRSDDNLPF